MTNPHQNNSMEKSKVNFDTLISSPHELDYSGTIAEALQAAPRLLSIEELAATIKHQLPRGNDSISIVGLALDTLFQAVEVAPNQFGWLTNLVDGTVLRHPLTAEEARQGFLLLDELEHAVFFPEFFQTHRSDDRILQIELFGGPVIPSEAYIERKTWSLRLGTQFTEWLDEQGGQGRDDIIITALDVAEGRYSLRLHPREARDNGLIQNRNVQLTLKAEEMVAKVQQLKGSMTTWDLAAGLLVQDVYRESVPPDDLHCVLHQYSLLHFDSSLGYTIKDEGTGPFSSPSNQKLYASGDSSSRKLDAKYDVPASKEVSVSSQKSELSDLIEDEYELYLDKLFQSGIMDSPFTEQEYKVLRAELDSLISLEQQFGYLLTEQRNRQHDLFACLLIEPGTISDDDRDLPSRSDFDEPPCWEN